MLFHPVSPLHGMSRNASLRSQDCILSPHNYVQSIISVVQKGCLSLLSCPRLFADCLKWCCCLKVMRSWEATTLTDALCSGFSKARCLANGDSLLCMHSSMPKSA